ncbi:exocyst complex component 3-like protein 2 [Ornithorhynchus anatinus]|uniref:exocyst complex component 3-like protein 2 n=1 Tax=Ornithorhynchus anatinus TaxID=9258 RepID=UPI0010A87ACC|nr:exocyst complex component 3-like protein 2 [Ornithorhynchus anatinus]XP_028921047.1 exocyst complex component 3-like protein 2 [Ornithorhynchus anatinus]
MSTLRNFRSPGPRDPPRPTTLQLKPTRSDNPFEASATTEEEEEEEGERREGAGGSRSSSWEDPSPSLPNGGSYRRATLEKLVGLSPFRLGKSPSRRGSPGEGEPRSFLDRVLGSGPGPRRSSEDFSLLQRLNGRPPKWSLGSLLEPETPTRLPLPFLRLGRGPKPRRASLVDRLLPAAPAPAPASAPKPPEPPQAKEPLSVLEILELIQQRELARADEHILELEAEELAAGSAPAGAGRAGGRRARDVALLYEALQRELWTVVAETLAAPGAAGGPGGPLAQLGQVLKQEEAADRRRGPGGSRELRAHWAEAVCRVAGERLAGAGAGTESGGGLASRLEGLQRRLLEDLGAVRSRLAPAYPPCLGAFRVYLRGYHGGLAAWMRSTACQGLLLPDRLALLHWHNHVYPREILGRADLAALEGTDELGPLLAPPTLRRLEDECVTDVKAQTRAALLQTLQEEEERWAAPARPEDETGSLARTVCGLLEEHTERAPSVSPEFQERVTLCCLGALAEFLQSFQQRVERFHENPSTRDLPPDSYTCRTITLVNCCPPVRVLAEQLARAGPLESEAMRETAASALERVTRLCHRVLADRLFLELQPHFNKLMKRKWLNSSEAFDSILGTLGAQALTLRRMHSEPYQVLMSELHRRVLVEYVRRLLRGRLSCRSARSRARVAAKLRDEATQLQRLFRRLESQASWLDAVVPHLADVLQLEDTPSIQVEVGGLVRDYPDIRRKHVAALLDVRGLHGAAARHEILAVARDLEQSGGPGAPPRDRAFFADIPVPRPPLCLGLHLARLPMAHLPAARLPRLRLPPRPRAQP